LARIMLGTARGTNEMMRTTFNIVAATVSAAGLLVAATAYGQTPPTRTRTIYISAVDNKDAPVDGLTAADFTVKEDGKVRDVISAEIAKTPMQIALMLDDSGLGLGAIRQGAGQFVETLQGKAEFAIITMAGRNLPLVDFTADAPALYAGLQKMLTRNTPATYLLDGLVEVAQTFQRRKAERPVIVAVVAEGEELSNARAEVVLDAIQKSGAKLYYVGLGAPVTQGNRPSYSSERAADSTEYESGKRNTVLGSGPKNSGGRGEQVLQTAAVSGLLKQFAVELAGQYAVTYKTEAADAKLNVETKHKGVKLRVPARVGSK
jgi:VWFA-related protein